VSTTYGGTVNDLSVTSAPPAWKQQNAFDGLLGKSIVLTSFKLFQRGTYRAQFQARAPGMFWVYGTNDTSEFATPTWTVSTGLSNSSTTPGWTLLYEQSERVLESRYSGWVGLEFSLQLDTEAK